MLLNNLTENKLRTMTIIRFEILFVSAMVFGLAFPAHAQTLDQYKSKLPENIRTIKEAQQEILSILNKKETVHFYSSKPYVRVKLTSNRTLIDKAVIAGDGFLITTSLITFNLDVAKSFNDVFFVWGNRLQKESGKHVVMYEIDLQFPEENLTKVYSQDYDLMCRLADDLYLIKRKTISESVESELTRFASVVEKNKGQAAKQPVSEEQRKFIVQANAATQTKDYGQALSYFKQALQINETGFPDAYFNMALIYAQLRQFDQAILSMKKYMLILPGSPDARNAQDKIYEWEAGINK
jgi:tetratricopeptide (TPR) repeat protein